MMSLRYAALALLMSAAASFASADERPRLSEADFERLVTCASIGTLLLVEGVETPAIKQEVNRIQNVLWGDTPSTERDDSYWARHDAIADPFWASAGTYKAAVARGDASFIEAETAKALACRDIDLPAFAIIEGRLE